MRFSKAAALGIFTVMSYTVAAQTPENATGTVEKSMFYVQIGGVGGWVGHEARLAAKWTLRTEVGLDLFGNTYEQENGNDVTKYSMAPTLNIEPRWYYNIEKRAKKGKVTANNCANFFGLSFKYAPDTFVLASDDRSNVPNQLIVAPRWAIRRHIGKNFNYELGAYAGYNFVFQNRSGNPDNNSQVVVDIHARIGYSF